MPTLAAIRRRHVPQHLLDVVAAAVVCGTTTSWARSSLAHTPKGIAQRVLSPTIVAPNMLDPDERAVVQRRVLRVLTAGQIVGAAALASAVTVGAFVVQTILGHTTPWAGIATATVTLGTAFMSQVLSQVMGRKGRRPGLQLGYLLAAGGGLLSAIGAERSQLPLFLVGLFLLGSGQASNLLARYAAADLAAADERSRAMSRILFASTFGAVLGPLLIGPAEHAGQRLGFGLYTGPWVFSALFFLGAATNTALRLRPDPLVLAAGLTTGEPNRPERLTARRALTIIVTTGPARLALTAMVLSQVTMVTVMAMTPVHLKLNGHEGVSAYVISSHIAGMYALSPLVGRFSDKRGRVPTIFVGSGLLFVASVLAAVSGDVEQLLFPALWLLGIGWSFGLIGGSTLLVESVRPRERVGVQGTADLLMSFCGGLAGLSSGFIRSAFGFHVLAQFAALAALVLIAVAAFAGRSR